MSDDNDWKQKVSTITDPFELLNELVDLHTYSGIDPYYKDLYEAIINQAITILQARKLVEWT